MKIGLLALFLYTVWKGHCGPHSVLTGLQFPVIGGVGRDGTASSSPHSLQGMIGMCEM